MTTKSSDKKVQTNQLYPAEIIHLLSPIRSVDQTSPCDNVRIIRDTPQHCIIVHIVIKRCKDTQQLTVHDAYKSSSPSLNILSMVGFLIDENDPQEIALKAPYIKLYTAGTPNGYKISIMLELLNLDYHVRTINLKENEQKEDWFLDLNPNGRIPVLSDVDANGEKITISESDAILLYLVEKYDKQNKFSYEIGTPQYYKMLEMLMFQMGGLGPMQGQAHHFCIYAPEKVPYGISRYVNETKRLYGVLETVLEATKSGFLVGDRLTVADVACWTWVRRHHNMDLDLNEYPRLSQWHDSLDKMEEFKKGLVP